MDYHIFDLKPTYGNKSVKLKKFFLRKELSGYFQLSSVFTALYSRCRRLQALSTITDTGQLYLLPHIRRERDRRRIRHAYIHAHLNATRADRKICHSVNVHARHARGHTWNVVWPHSGVCTVWSSNTDFGHWLASSTAAFERRGAYE